MVASEVVWSPRHHRHSECRNIVSQFRMSLSRHVWEETSLKLAHWHKCWNHRRLIYIRVHFLLLAWASQAPVAHWCRRCPCHDIWVIVDNFSTTLTFGWRSELRAPIPDNAISYRHLPPLGHWVLIFHFIMLSRFFQFNGPFLIFGITGATFILEIGGNLLLLDRLCCLLLIFVGSLPWEVYFIGGTFRYKLSVNGEYHLIFI